MTNIVVINSSGNVGKTIIAKHIIGAKYLKPKYISYSQKEHGDISGFVELSLPLLDEGNVIIDISSNHTNLFMRQLHEYKESIQDYDVFYIPVTRYEKVQRDSIKTIEKLIELGATPDQFKIILNFIRDTSDILEQFSILIPFLEKYEIEFSPKLYIPENNIFLKEVISDNEILESILREITPYL